MLILLSSGARPRYRDDIIRSLALPLGGSVQFRYEKSIVSADIKRAPESFADQTALVCYLSNRVPGDPTEIVPCRFMTVAGITPIGSSYIFDLRAVEFAGGLNDAGFRGQLQAPELDLVPRWEKNAQAGDELVGCFAFPVAADFKSFHRPDVDAFEEAVKALGRHDDFTTADALGFYSVREIKELIDTEDGPSQRLIAPERCSGSYELKSGSRYEIEIYSFSPLKGVLDTVTASKLGISSDTAAIEFPFGKTAQIDSEYDLLRFRFGVEERIDSVGGALRLFQNSGGEDADDRAEIVLPVTFSGSRRLVIAKILFAAVAASVPAIIVGLNSDKGLSFG